MSLLTDRQAIILNRTIMTHIEKGLPIGSRFLTEEYDLGYSSATIRHEMNVLDELGFLDQPHISAGRIPTDLGYRYYVDHFLDEDAFISRSFSDQAFDQLEQSFADSDAEGLAETASDMLASVLEETGLVLLIKPELLRYNERRNRKLFLQGVSHILDKPEFQNVGKVKPLLKAFDEKDCIVDSLIQSAGDHSVVTTIGHENRSQFFWDCSVVAAPYYVNSQYRGSIGVIGSRRMHYQKAISSVKMMALMVGQVFERRRG